MFPAALGLLFCGCANAQLQDLEIIECIYPPQVRFVGGRTYMVPRKPGRTTIADCRRRGGEGVLYDRANYQTALNAWRQTAESSDVPRDDRLEAMTIVGEIYEKGLAGEPDPAAAALWYRRAADEGYSRAQFNLGALYEQGLGVPEDTLEALNWYRRASGLREDNLMFESRKAEEVAQLREALEAQVEERNERIVVLERRISELEQAAAEDQAAAIERETLLDSVNVLRSALAATEQQLVALPTSTTDETELFGRYSDDVKQRTYRQRDFGRYHALIIGVQDYPVLAESVPSALGDVERVAQVLSDKYGFRVSILTNPTQGQVGEALNQLSQSLSERDNLLIYFAGISERLRRTQQLEDEDGYWLPTDAQPAPNDSLWVPNDFVTRHLGRSNAKRVLVISDASYTGLLSTEPGQLVVRDRAYSDAYVDWKLPMRSRLLLSSGADRPLGTGASSEHSVFADAFIAELESSSQLLTAPELHLRIRDRIENDGLTPELKSIREAGHEVGDFFFVPNT